MIKPSSSPNPNRVESPFSQSSVSIQEEKNQSSVKKPLLYFVFTLTILILAGAGFLLFKNTPSSTSSTSRNLEIFPVEKFLSNYKPLIGIPRTSPELVLGF